MKIFVDTNIFIDILIDREPHSQDSATIFQLCENHILEGYIAPITINNIHHICRKSVKPKLIESYLFDIATYFTIAKMDVETIAKANSLKTGDYEDALQYEMAIRNGCDYLLTRNTKDYKYLKSIKVLTPSELLLTI
jgi:predicted nucleic acid-binding protein